MNLRLSIIIPCYNCERTLREAVASCFTQGLSLEEFEIIMVDDSSTDGTRTLMQSLASKHRNIRLLFHEHNRGGGAARNTGIAAAQSPFIFCLDSDNFFPPETVPKLLATQKKYQCDGVAISERRFFLGNNPKKYHSHFNQIVDRSITIADIFTLENGSTLLDNFLFSKAAYETVGGYPEHHGFDTQCFELRFLSKNHTVRIAPESVFYHRQSPRRDSYFDRVYKEGLFSRNFYLICEDIMHLFSYNTREFIMHFDVFAQNKLDTHNLKAQLDIKFKENPSDFFAPQYEALMTSDGATKCLASIATSSAPADIFTRAVLLYKSARYPEALAAVEQLLAQGNTSPLVYYTLLRTSTAISGKYPPAQVENETQKLLLALTPARQSMAPRSPLATMIITLLRSLRGH